MFRKLVSNLPFSPSLIQQVGFYTSRLKKEEFTRRLGLIFTALLLIVQSLTVFVPAKPAIAASTNDIVFGGGNREELLRVYRKGCDNRNRCDIKQIFEAYGINEGNLMAATYETIHSSQANNFWSTGRSPRGYGGEVAKQVPNGPKIWSRTLHGWKSNYNWKALKVHTTQGTRWILLDCGNIVTQTTAKPKNPNMKLVKTVNKSTAKKGEKVTFTLKATNIGDATAKNVLIYDDAPVGLDLLNDGLATDPIKSPRRWEASRRFDIAPGQSYTYKINAVVTKWGPVTLTNQACVDFFDINIWDNCGSATVSVPQGCPLAGKTHLPKDDAACKTNPDVTIEKVTSKKEVRIGDEFDYTLKIKNSGDVNLTDVVVSDQAPSEIEFLRVKVPRATNFRDVVNAREFTSGSFALRKGESTEIVIRAKAIKENKAGVKNTACVLSTGKNNGAGACDDDTIKITAPCPTNSLVTKDSSNCYPPCPIEGKQNVSIDSPECTPCDDTRQTTDGKDISCLELHKTAKNVTQQITNANGTKANPGDMIEYTLSVKNFGRDTRKAFVIEENMEDVLEYADIIDASGATFTKEPIHLLSWGPIDIKPNEVVTRTVLIKVKSSIPTTPASTSDPLSSDLKMVNVYGDTVSIELPKHPIKTVEQTIATLPSTGFGANMLISTVLVMAITYFYLRSRTMKKELVILRRQFQTGSIVS